MTHQMLPHLSGVPHPHVKQALRRALLEPALSGRKARGYTLQRSIREGSARKG